MFCSPFPEDPLIPVAQVLSIPGKERTTVADENNAI